MIVPLYAMFDKLNGFMQPMTDVDVNTAKRNFSYAISSNPQLKFSAGDYDLYELGTFNSETGEILSHIPTMVMRGSSVVGGETHVEDSV